MAPRFWQTSQPYLHQGADYAHHITTCPLSFENLKASFCINPKIVKNANVMCEWPLSRRCGRGGGYTKSGGAQLPQDALLASKRPR